MKKLLVFLCLVMLFPVLEGGQNLFAGSFEYQIQTTLLKSGSFYYGLCLGNDGNILISEVQNDVLMNIDRNGKLISQTDSPTLDAFGIIQRQDGTTFIADGASYKIYKGNLLAGFTEFSTSYQYPRGMTLRGTDLYGVYHSYGTSQPAGGIYRINAVDEIFHVMDLGNGLSDIVFDSRGNMFISDYINDVVFRIDTDLNSSVYVDGLETPWGLAIDRNDNLIIADRSKYGGSIFLKEQSGSIVELARNLDNPMDIVYAQDRYYYTTSTGFFEMRLTASPIPEPATLLLLGSSLLGFIGLKKHRKH